MFPAWAASRPPEHAQNCRPVETAGVGPGGYGNFRNLFADPAGARIGYLIYENGKPYPRGNLSLPVRTEWVANLIAPLSGGRNFYAGLPPLSFLYRVDSATKSRRNYATSATGVLDFFRLSADARMVAFIEEQRDYKPVATMSLVIRWVDLGSSREQSLPPVSTKPVVLRWLNLIGWLPAH